MKQTIALFLMSFLLLTSAHASIDEAQFNQILKRAVRVYTPIFANEGLTLKMHNYWPKDVENASASQMKREHGIAHVNMYGGLARQSAMTYDGFMLVVLHEIGHHLGGAPRSPKSFMSPSEQMTIEGQADYYATLKGARIIFGNENNVKIVSKMQLDPIVVAKCTQAYATAADIALCERSGMAALVLAKSLASMGREPNVPSFSTPTTSQVDKTISNHPPAQCRLDTMIAGAICTHKVEESLSKSDARVGTCNVSMGDKEGFRPGCWYREDLARDHQMFLQAID